MSLPDSDLKAIDVQYQGFANTPNLWFGDSVYGLNQFEYTSHSNTEITDIANLPYRLGKRVEHFVCYDLEQHSDINLLAHNLQIQHNKQTIGELDVLLKHKQQPVHLEIIYKFYVYDPTVGTSELEHWIGPNRKDSLVQKLEKLKNKQLPLLFRPDTASYLQDLGLDSGQIQQNVLFKAQLFVPRVLKNSHFEQVNNACIAGVYIKKEVLPSFQYCQFYIPSKVNWLAGIQPQITWLEYANFNTELQVFLDKNQSPLVWIKHPNGNTERVFVVWW